MPRLAALVLLAALGGLAPAARAQSIWLDRVSPRTIHLEVARPFFEDDDLGFSTTWFLSGRFPLGERLALVGEIPFATARAELALPPFGTFEESSSTLGNPYLGIETRPEGGHGAWFEFGIRAPAASNTELATFTGLVTDVNRLEAFLPDAIVLRPGLHWRDDIAGKPGIDVHVAPMLLTSEDFDDLELVTTYGLQFLHHGTDARVGAGLSGHWFVTSSADFAGSSNHQVEAAADFLPGRIRPGVTARVPLDDYGVDFVLGLTLNVLLP